MDTTQYAEGQFINPELVKKSPSKKVFITADAKAVDGKYGKKLELQVELDAKPKTWNPNRDHIIVLQQAYGKDSRTWIGKSVILQVATVNNKEILIATADQVKEEIVQ